MNHLNIESLGDDKFLALVEAVNNHKEGSKFINLFFNLNMDNYVHKYAARRTIITKAKLIANSNRAIFLDKVNLIIPSLTISG